MIINSNPVNTHQKFGAVKARTDFSERLAEAYIGSPSSATKIVDKLSRVADAQRNNTLYDLHIGVTDKGGICMSVFNKVKNQFDSFMNDFIAKKFTEVRNTDDLVKVLGETSEQLTQRNTTYWGTKAGVENMKLGVLEK
ncbi:MAG: hypothetical protein PHE78_08030 [Candidatus Gastranaerophilales bacterium]|nr:hypothetical protein [Candidatus Gastranaerophilales bacterium]